MDWIALVGAAGIGSLLTTVAQSILVSKRFASQRSFEERKEAYVGLLQSYHKAAVEQTDAAAKDFAYWQMRCEIVAPKSVRFAIEDIIKSNDDLKWRSRAHDELKTAMRRDLGVTTE